jgi:hypothetical protein
MGVPYIPIIPQTQPSQQKAYENALRAGVPIQRQPVCILSSLKILLLSDCL